MAKEKTQFRARLLAEFVNRAIDPLVAKRGFGETTLLTQWDGIAGARLAQICEPERLKWPPRAKNAAKEAAEAAATLSLRVEPGFGLDVQHMTGTLIDRINAHLGWRCVSRIAIRQEPLHRPQKKKPARTTADAETRRQAEAAAAGVENPKLREALIKLGEFSLSPK